MSAVVETQPPKANLMQKFASKYDIEPARMLETLKGTAFKNPKEGPPITNEQLVALIVVANQYGLNPFTKEIYAFPDKQNGIVPVVGVDGWSRIINSHAMFDGIEFVDGPADRAGVPEWIECVIYRKDRERPTRVREYLAECKRGTGPWGSHPRRMLRHKSMIQCGRLAFGYTGIYDQDEAERIVQAEVHVGSNDAIGALNASIKPALTHGTDAAEGAPAGKDEEPQGGAPTVTYAMVRESLEAATTADALDIAADTIGAVDDEAHRAELAELYRELREKLAP